MENSEKPLVVGTFVSWIVGETQERTTTWESGARYGGMWRPSGGHAGCRGRPGTRTAETRASPPGHGTSESVRYSSLQVIS